MLLLLFSATAFSQPAKKSLPNIIYIYADDLGYAEPGFYGQQKITNTDGVSFLPELLDNSTRQKKYEYIYFEYPENGGQVAIRIGDWKAVRMNVRKQPKAPWQIFNLKTDINETTDEAAKHPELVKQFNDIQRRAHQCSHIKEWELIDPKLSVQNIK